MKNRLWLLTILFVVGTGTIFSQSYNESLRLSLSGIGSSARALGMGNAYTALSNDYNGTFFNPAGLALARDFEFTGSLSSDSYSNDVTFFNNETNYSNSSTDVNQFGFVIPVPTTKGSLVFAMGYNKVKNFNSAMKFDGYNSGDNSYISYLTESGDDLPYNLYLSYATGYDEDGYVTDFGTILNGGLNQSGDITESGGINKWSFSGAVQVSRELYVGGTLNIISGTYESDRNYYEDDTKDNYDSSVLTDSLEPATADFQSFYLNDILDWDLSGWDAKIGLMYVLPQHFNVGLTVKFPSFYTIEEDYYVDATSEFADFYVYLDSPIHSRVKYEIKTPYEFTGALSYNFNGLTLSGEATYIDYTQTEYDQSDDEEVSTLDASYINSLNMNIKDYFRSVVNYNLGAEYVLPIQNNKLALRAGYMVKPSAYDGDASDYDMKFVTFGMGFTPANSPFSLDLAYAYGTWKDIGDNYGSGVSRTYQDISKKNFVLSVNYKFQ